MATVGQSQPLAWPVGQPQPRKPILSRRLAAHFARRFNMQFIFLAPVDVDDGQGGSLRTWNGFAQTLGALEPLTGQEREFAGVAEQVSSHYILVAYRNDITPAMRVRSGARFFDINDVTDLASQQLITQLGVLERFVK